MKNKLFILIVVMAMTISGCGSAATSTQKDSKATESVKPSESKADKKSTELTSSELSALGDVSVEKDDSEVKLTIPAEYVKGETQDQLNADANEKGYKSVTLNSDGSATYVMTTSQHKAMMDSLKETIDKALKDMIGSNDYPNITNIAANDDYTTFTVTTKSEKLDMSESLSTMLFYTYGGMYNIFNGSNVDNIHVDFTNATSGQIINSADSKDAATKK